MLLLIESSTELPGHWVCTAIVMHCVVSNVTSVGGKQHVYSWTLDVDCRGGVTYG